MKGQIFESPRGPMFIDAQTRDVVHNVYIRKVEKKNGQLFNVEFDVIKDVDDRAARIDGTAGGHPQHGPAACAVVLRVEPRYWLLEIREPTTWGALTARGGFLS